MQVEERHPPALEPHGLEQGRQPRLGGQHRRLGQRLVPLGRRLRAEGDAAAGAVAGRAGGELHLHGADGHVEGGVAAGRDHPHRAAVGAARRALQRRDELHGRGLGRAGDGAAGEGGGQEVGQAGAGPEARLHRRGELPDGPQPRRREEGRGRHRAGLGHAAQVVAEEVGDHDVLGPVLLRGGQPVARRRVLGREAAAPRRPLHRAGGDAVAAPREGRAPATPRRWPAPPREVGGLAAALRGAEAPVERQRVAVEPAAQAQREVDLVGDAGGDGLAQRRHRGGVLGRPVLGREVEEAGLGPVRRRGGRRRGQRRVVEAEPEERALRGPRDEGARRGRAPPRRRSSRPPTGRPALPPPPRAAPAAPRPRWPPR